MHIKTAKLTKFKRFSELTITGLDKNVKLVVMTGPNGCGKSSVFDAFKVWSWAHGSPGQSYDAIYHNKAGLANIAWHQLVNLELYESFPTDQRLQKKAFYVRSAYRNEADFTIANFQRTGSALDEPRISRLIDNDASVSENYRRLVSASIEGLYNGRYDNMNVSDLRESFIGKVRESMHNVFGDLLLKGPGNPLNHGSFFFDKGVSTDFHYKNLSGGEKAAFDILLDVIVKKTEFDDTIFCIDEPEEHMHTRLQGLLLNELFSLIPDNSQLWIATHSIGMMRKAKEIQNVNPAQVAFIDFHGHDFDQPVSLSPTNADRKFWTNTLSVALDDLANLVAPSQLVLCEGKPPATSTGKAEFDARCYRIIFSGEFYDTDFISVGNALQVQTDTAQVGRSIQAIISGTKVIRLIDRDDRSVQEIQDLSKEGVRVLTRRHLESYLFDDEILLALCNQVGQPQNIQTVLAAKQKALADSVARGNPKDDIKSASGSIYVETKKILRLTQVGNTTEAFMRDSLAPLVISTTKVYVELRKDIFNK
jgi:hypothetical protein